jgi:rhodanese-related sulfurtransferase
MKKAIIWIVLAAALGVGVFFAFRPSGGGIKVVDAAGVTASQAKGAQVVDVRSAGEYEMGHIPGAINVPVDEVQTTAANWDKTKTYVVYCATGARSAAAVATMQSMGFTNIDHFAAGIQAWTGKLDTGTAKATGTVPTSGKPVMVEFYTNS